MIAMENVETSAAVQQSYIEPIGRVSSGISGSNPERHVAANHFVGVAGCISELGQYESKEGRINRPSL
jgi:hypothetical protein